MWWTSHKHLDPDLITRWRWVSELSSASVSSCLWLWMRARILRASFSNEHWNSLSCTVWNSPPPFVLTRFWFLTVSVLDCFCLLRRHRKRLNIWLHLSGQKQKILLIRIYCLNYEFFVFTFSECTLTNVDWIQLSFSCFGSFILKCVSLTKAWSLIYARVGFFLCHWFHLTSINF